MDQDSTAMQGRTMVDNSGSRTVAPLALESFCRTEYPRVFGVLVLFTGEPALAEELTQETFVRVCRDWAKVSNHDRPGAWAQKVAMNLARSRFRKRGSRRRAEARLRAGAVEPQPPASADVIATRAAVASLPGDQRAVIVLRYFADASVDDTALALGIPVGTVKTRTRNAIAALRHAGLHIDDLDTQFPDEPNDLLEVRT
ncbi:MAG: RNA polymerase sigma-70 factor (sigma-E family) [Candidatus Aldehydirespiratoraceae bacterium]|jgi:RNA polymerase sigma-70 factor (sigma-E family)